MPGPTKIAIGIQARSGSKRFPKKVFETIGGEPIIDWVWTACLRAKDRFALGDVSVTVLVPKGDPLRNGQDSVLEGSETDVLSRYVQLLHLKEADYVVRITADCPLISAHVIGTVLMTAVEGNYDYISNVDSRCRTAPDGFDCEVMSARMLEWLDSATTLDSDREHVTLLARNFAPSWAKRAMIVNSLDMSGIKVSVDTPEDLEEVRLEFEAANRCRKIAELIYGKENVFIA